MQVASCMYDATQTGANRPPSEDVLYVTYSPAMLVQNCTANPTNVSEDKRARSSASSDREMYAAQEVGGGELWTADSGLT